VLERNRISIVSQLGTERIKMGGFELCEFENLMNCDGQN
jgi:hypothetical protein